ncbi:MAG: ATP-binding protein [Chloroflexi bacterium]|nr:ATP-binding protein [Chloroflexota bacterium]
MAGYRRRIVDGVIEELFKQLPALFIVGPRAIGKTTTAARHARTVIRLDREADAVAFRADPDAALRGLPEPVVLDEWQVVPSVLGAVKRAVDARPDPGRFLITGSVRGEFDGELWPGTGRLVRVPMYGMTIREQVGAVGQAPFIDRVLSGDAIRPANGTTDLRGYVDLALRGGFPEPALAMSEGARRRWLESYVEQLLTHDMEQVDGGRDPARLRRYVEAYALSTAGVVDDKTLYDAAGINRRTALAYERLLLDLSFVEAMPAWTSNRLKRLVLGPKRYLMDAALVGGVLRLDTNGVLRSGNMLGRLLDTFVASQLRADLIASRVRPRLYHVRQEQGRFEIDLLAELGGGRFIAIEVKADAAPSSESSRHLVGLRDRFGDSFVAGIVLHTGPRVYALGDRIVAAPISSIWA